jgi:hypothetical protein
MMLLGLPRQMPQRQIGGQESGVGNEFLWHNPVDPQEPNRCRQRASDLGIHD